MSGRWVEAWDANANKWLKLYIEEPPRNYSGTAYVISQPTPEHPLILGPDGKPIAHPEAEPKRAGFRR